MPSSTSRAPGKTCEVYLTLAPATADYSGSQCSWAASAAPTLFREALVYHDDEALYFELKGKDSGIVRFSFEMLETLGRVIEEEQEEQEASPQ